MNTPAGWLRRLLGSAWVGVAPLIALALIAAGGRAVALATGAEPFAFIYGAFPLSAAQDARLLDRWFAAHAPLTWTHIVAGSVVLGLAPLQFIHRVRQRHIRFHRWSGRLVLLAVIPAGLSGVLLQVQSPYGGGLALSAIVMAGALFLVSGSRAYWAIRRKDIARHREWMIRLLAVGLGVATVRLVALPLILITGRRPLDLVGLAFWLGFAIPILAGEWWIRSTRRPRPTVTPRVAIP